MVVYRMCEFVVVFTEEFRRALLPDTSFCQSTTTRMRVDSQNTNTNTNTNAIVLTLSKVKGPEVATRRTSSKTRSSTEGFWDNS